MGTRCTFAIALGAVQVVERVNRSVPNGAQPGWVCSTANPVPMPAIARRASDHCTPAGRCTSNLPTGEQPVSVPVFDARSVDARSVDARSVATRSVAARSVAPVRWQIVSSIAPPMSSEGTRAGQPREAMGNEVYPDETSDANCEPLSLYPTSYISYRESFV